MIGSSKRNAVPPSQAGVAQLRSAANSSCGVIALYSTVGTSSPYHKKSIQVSTLVDPGRHSISDQDIQERRAGVFFSVA